MKNLSYIFFPVGSEPEPVIQSIATCLQPLPEPSL